MRVYIQGSDESMFTKGGKLQHWLLTAICGIGAAIWLFLFVGGLRAYPGSVGVYVLFSVVYLVLLLSALCRQRSYVYIFLVVLLWLGFWNKLAWYFAGAIHLPEPIGRFVPNAANWDEVLFVATAAGVALLVSGFLWSWLTRALDVTGLSGGGTLCGNGICYPDWLVRLNLWSLVLFVGVTIALVWANLHWGITMVGIQTQTVLPWPLNAMISLMLMGGGGLSVWAGAMIWWQASAGRPVFIYVAIYTICAALVSAGSLSRATVVAYALPLLFALYLNRRAIADFTWTRFIFICILFGATLLASFSIVNQLRSDRYFSSAIAERDPPQLNFGNEINRFLGFSVGRWVGIEGVMAVSAWPDKNFSLLTTAILERPEEGNAALYQKVAPFPEYENMAPRVVFSSIPGGIGFLYYSGSVLVVFALTVVIALSMQLAELVIHRLTANPLLCSSTGFLMAMIFVQHWGMSYYVLPFIGFVGLSILLVSLVQSHWLMRRMSFFERSGVGS